MEPFDEFTNVGALSGSIGQLVSHAANVLNNKRDTDAAYKPVQADWHGLGHSEAARAPVPLARTAHASSGAILWAAVCTNFWAGCLRGFNRRVEQILASYHSAVSTLDSSGPDGGEQPLGLAPKQPLCTSDGVEVPNSDGPPSTVGQRKAAALAHAKRQWHEAYANYVEDGRSTVNGMLAKGPTKDNVGLASLMGRLPHAAEQVWQKTLAGLSGYAPIGLRTPAQQGLWVAGSTATGTGWWAKYLTDIRFAKKLPKGRAGYQAWKAGQTGWYDHPKHTKSPGTRKAYRIRATKFGKWAGRAGAVVTFGTGAYSQWQQDVDRHDLSGGDKVTRAAERGALDAGGAWAGAAAGARWGGEAGATVGVWFDGVGVLPGAVIGGAVGGIAGAAAGSGLGDLIADGFIDD